MKRFFYLRLALSNIKKNAKLYFPYLITSMFTVMMFYVIHSLSVNPGLAEDSRTAPVVLRLGTWVVVIFSVIFLFYVNSFLIKRRKKEMALYNILGMEKRHIMILMFCETILTSLTSLFGGLLLGALFSHLMFLLLIHLTHLNTSIYYEISLSSIGMTCLIYGIIFFLAYLFHVIQIKMANPIELLKGGQVGEKEPKSKKLLTLIGVLSLSAGYYIAQTINDPIEALLLFFVAVVFVIIGTYCLFTAGSIVLLKALKKNKRFYYQTRHFTSVSQMIYRMKQNAVGLASICILCTCILVMISSTISLYLGVKDSVRMILQESYRIRIYSNEDQNLPSPDMIDEYCYDLQKELQKEGIELENLIAKKTLQIAFNDENGNFVTGYGSSSNYFSSFSIMNIDDYNKTYDRHIELDDQQVLVASNYYEFANDITINDQSFVIRDVVDDPYLYDDQNPTVARWVTVIFKDEQIVNELFSKEDYVLDPFIQISIDYKDDQYAKQAEDVIKDVNLSYFNQDQNMNHFGYMTYSQYDNENTMMEAYGSLFFLGLFLAVLFMMAAILIMYYKQLSEGYEDQRRFEIMQNVGMSQKEVKQTIRSQVLIFFFLPLVVAVMHMAFAFKMIVKMFGYLLSSGQNLFIFCTLIAIVILTILYTIVYILTAKTYYQIVQK